MRAVIQRVTSASVTIGGEVKSSIGPGLLILLGVGHDDGQEDLDWLVKKDISGKHRDFQTHFFGIGYASRCCMRCF